MGHQLIDTPATIVIAGASQSGKSTIIERLLREQEQNFGKKFDKIIYCYGRKIKCAKKLILQAMFLGSLNNRLLNLERNIENLTLFDGFPTAILHKPEDTFDSKKNNFMVLDDLMYESMNKVELGKLFSKLAHHFNITTVLTLQNLFFQSKEVRNVTRNATVLILTVSHYML